MQHTTSPPQQFCLRWNNYQTNLTSVFDQLLQSESFVDVTLACDGHSVKAHKMVLSACSPYFQSLFFDNPCQHPIVIMRDIKWPELKAAVEFMYKGEINVSQEQIGPLLKVAETLKIRGLADVNGEQDLSAGPPVDIPKATTCAPPPMRPPREWEATSRADLSEDGMSPSLMTSTHRLKKRRRLSGERSSSMSSPADSLVAEPHEATPADLSPAPPPTPVPRQQTPQPPQRQSSPQQQQQAQQREGSGAQPAVSQQSPMPPVQTNNIGGGPDQGMPTMSLPLPPPPPPMPHVPAMTHLTSHPADDMEIKPGIAEMIREEERAKLLESSHAWLGASTSSIAEYPSLLKLKAPTWTQNQLKEAIDAVVTQKMRFTQASARYGIPKGTLYDNILGKSKRMVVLEEAGLTSDEENAVLEFCCDVSTSPYNRRTKKSLASVLMFVEKIRRRRDPEFMFTGLSGFRWWWAFCKKHSVVSLYYDNNNCSNAISHPEKGQAADSYQYQLQSMWQKCWNTNQSLVHNLRFRERGPLKSWRPETMAEAIFSVLKEGLSLSQAARKYDIPYPTFVLYANRVHNMLGPSADGGADLRPKGRGRPQRILLGVWPDEHIRGVIRAVVFRDSHHHIKEEAHLAGAYPRLHDGLSVQSYPSSSCSNGPEPTVSPSSAAAAAVAAVAQGLRQQMCSMVAAAQHHPGAHHDPISLVNSLSLSGLMPGARSPTDSAHDLRISPATSAHDLDSPISSPLTIEPALNLNISNNVEVGIGVSGMTYKPPRSYSSPRPENLFQEDIEELVKSPLQLTSPRVSISEPKDLPIKMESMAECRGE